jgi:hypothetical protein
MKRIIVSENGLNKINSIISEESMYDRHIARGRKYLDGKYQVGVCDNNNGKYVRVYTEKSCGMPTNKSVWKEDVLDDLDRYFFDEITNEKERKELINRLLYNWENNSFTTYGTPK